MFIKSCLVVIISVLMITIIKQYRPEFSVPFSLCVSIYLIWLLVQNFSGVNNLYIKSDILNINSDILSSCIKLTGISYARVFCCNFCRDNGQNSLGDKIDLIAKITSLIIIFPWMNELYVNIINLL